MFINAGIATALLVGAAGPARSQEPCTSAFAALKSALQAEPDFGPLSRRPHAQGRIKIPAAGTPVAQLRNPQLSIWALRSMGKNTEADRLEAEAIHALQSEAIARETRLDSSAGMNDPYQIRLANGLEGIWKIEASDFSNAGAEIAAYKVDRELGLNRVPITVRRPRNGRDWSVQLHVKDLDNVSGQPAYPRQLALFDFLIGNTDRRAANYLFSHGRTVAIDHGSAFERMPRYQMDRMFEQPLARARAARGRSDEALERARATQDLADLVFTRNVFEKLRDTPGERWRDLLAGDLTPDRIKLFLERRAEVIRWVEKARTELGDEIFPDGTRSSFFQPALVIPK